MYQDETASRFGSGCTVSGLGCTMHNRQNRIPEESVGTYFGICATSARKVSGSLGAEISKFIPNERGLVGRGHALQGFELRAFNLLSFPT